MNIIDETVKDYISLCTQRLQSIFPNYNSCSEKDPIYDIERYYFRKIKSNIRRVHVSSCLSSLPPQLKVAYKEIIKSISEGNELLKYQSRLLKNVNFDDMMLADWGIQHLHLETEVESDGYVKRTSELLFVRFTDDDAFIIGIYQHGDWTDLDIIETIHFEWPDSIEKFKMNGIIALEHNISNSERQLLRNSGMNTPIQVSDGAIYMGPGMGMSTAGSPVMTTMNGDNHLRYLHGGFDLIRQHISTILPDDYENEKVTVGIEIDSTVGRILFKIKEIGMILQVEE